MCNAYRGFVYWQAGDGWWLDARDSYENRHIFGRSETEIHRVIDSIRNWELAQ